MTPIPIPPDERRDLSFIRDALRPFAKFIEGDDAIPDDTPMTQFANQMAKRITAGECRQAAAALAKADAILASEAARGVPDGWKLVPMEPSREMMNATREAFEQVDSFVMEMAVARGRRLTPHPDGSPLHRAYRAMIAAAPPSPGDPK